MITLSELLSARLAVVGHKLDTGAAGAAWQDRNAVAALPVWVASQEMSVGHAMANNIYGGRMFDGVGETNDMQSAHCGEC